MLTTLKIAILVMNLSAYPKCDVVDWALDNMRDNGAESVGVSCDVGAEEMGSEDYNFFLIGPDFIMDQIY